MIKETAPHEVEIWEDDPFNLEESLDENVAHFIWQGVDNIKLAANTSEQRGADQNAWSQGGARPLMCLALSPCRSAFLETVSVYVSEPFDSSSVTIAVCQNHNASQTQALDSRYVPILTNRIVSKRIDYAWYFSSEHQATQGYITSMRRKGIPLSPLTDSWTKQLPLFALAKITEPADERPAKGKLGVFLSAALCHRRTLLRLAAISEERKAIPRDKSTREDHAT